MKSKTGRPMCNLYLCQLWAWIPLVILLAGGCDGCKAPGPRELVCRPVAYFEVLEPERDAGAGAFSIERLGPELKNEQVRRKPDSLTFTVENHLITSWALFDFFAESDAIYSPAEGLARSVEFPDDVYPIKRFSDGRSERVRLGFRSSVCREPNRPGDPYSCKLVEDDLPLVADMTCTWELYDPDEEIE